MKRACKIAGMARRTKVGTVVLAGVGGLLGAYVAAKIMGFNPTALAVGGVSGALVTIPVVTVGCRLLTLGES